MSDNKNQGNNAIFRQKSLDRVSSVEDLDKYIKTTTPSLWLLLASIIVFLVGIIAWAAIGKINVESVTGINVTSGNITCIVAEEKYELIDEDSFIEIDNKEYKITDVKGPYKANQESNSSLLHTSNIEDDAWYYEVIGTGDLKDGDYKGKVVFEQVSPITFIIN